MAGVNTIDFVVENVAAIGYTGLRAEILRSNVRIPPGVPPEILTPSAEPNRRRGIHGDAGRQCPRYSALEFPVEQGRCRPPGRNGTDTDLRM